MKRVEREEKERCCPDNHVNKEKSPKGANTSAGARKGGKKIAAKAEPEKFDA